MKNRSRATGPLAVFVIFGVVACIFWPTASHLLAWQDNDPGTHSLVVVLVAWVLIFGLRDELSALPILPFPAGLIGLMGLGFIWLSGQLVFTVVFTQFAVIAMVPMAVMTLLGISWLTAMALPFFVLLFALPLWSPLIPTLVKWTAAVVELAIRASGVPIYRDGAYFVLPSGSWSIADACSGAMFLSTCLLLGILYASTIYRSTKKRLLFVAGSAMIGVIGNWVRVYMTMMIAHITDNRLLRDQHYTFGWFLFAVLLTVYCWVGWRYRDTVQVAGSGPQPSGVQAIADSSSSHKAGKSYFVILAVAIMATLIAWRLLETRLSVPYEGRKIEIADLSPHGDWLGVEKPNVEWAPELKNVSSFRVQSFEKGGQRVSVFVGVFQNESWNSKLVSVANQLASGEKSKWSLAERGVSLIEKSDGQFLAKTGIVIGGRDRILAWHWYWIDGISTSNDLRAKLEQLFMRLQGRRVASAWVAIYAVSDSPSNASSKLMQEFMRDMGGSLESALVRTAKK